MKLRRSAAPLVLCLCLLTACAQDYLASGLPLLEGKPVAQAIHYLGPPTEEKKASGKTTYSWVNEQTGNFNTSGEAGYPVVVQSGGHPVMSFSAPGRAPVENTYDWHCRLDITAEKGVIVHTGYQGNTAGCGTFSDRLKPLVTGP